MLGAGAADAARNDLAALGDKLLQHAVVLVINLVNPLDAELADLAAAQKGLLGSALRAAGGRTGGAFHITHGEVPRRGWRIRGGRRVRPRARSPRARKPPRGGA